VLKGAYLLAITLDDQTYRTTKDIDFLKTGDTDREYIQESLKHISSIKYPQDAVEFDTESITLQDIREQNSYHGQRAKIQAHIGKARVVLQIDIGIGDSVYPGIIQKDIPSILDLEEPSINSYPIETVIAEKLEAIVALSLLTSRMNDFYDLYIILRTFTLGFTDIETAIRETFNQRKTAIPVKMPVVFTDKIYQDPVKQKQWKAFAGKLRNEYSALKLSEVVARISQFCDLFWSNGTRQPVR